MPQQLDHKRTLDPYPGGGHRTPGPGQRRRFPDLLGFADDASYLAWLEANLKNNALVPDGFLAAHPDWDTTCYNDYLADMFDVPNGGTITTGFDNNLEWENLWLLGAGGLAPLRRRRGC